MRIAIIGAGIGGLAIAAALHQRGFEPQVFEQADRFARVGAGLQQSPNAVKVHRGLGIEDRVRQVANRPATSLSRDGITGAITNNHPLGAAVEARYGAPYLTMHRGDLHEAPALRGAGGVHSSRPQTRRHRGARTADRAHICGRHRD